MQLCSMVLGSTFPSFFFDLPSTLVDHARVHERRKQRTARIIHEPRWSHSLSDPLFQPPHITLNSCRRAFVIAHHCCANLPTWRCLPGLFGSEMVQSYLSHYRRDLETLPRRTKRFHAGDLRLLKRHVWEGHPRFRLAFHITRISDAAERLPCREYISWLQVEYPREVFSDDKFERLERLVPDTSLSSREADLQLLEGVLARYNPRTMLELDEDILEVVRVILKVLRRFQTDLYVPEIRKTLQCYSIRTSLKWLYDSLYRYRGWGFYSYPQPVELTVGDRYALQAAIKYYNPESFRPENEGAVPMVTLIRAYLRWYLWKLRRRQHHGAKRYLVVKNWRIYTWRPRLDPIRE